MTKSRGIINNMKILHIWDVAGVTSILAKYQKKMGHETKVMMLKKHDPMEVSEFYNKTYDMNAKKFILLVLWEARKYDVLHIHNLSIIIPALRILYPKKKIFIHHHGFTSAIKRYSKIVNNLVDGVFIATEDLFKVFPNAKLIPTPVDIEHFKKGVLGYGKLSFHTKHLDFEKFKEHVKDDTIDIIDRDKNPVPYHLMPDLLRNYNVYYDIKYIPQGLGKVSSKTCFEALACGLTVVDFEGKRLLGLPEKNHPNYSANLCLKYYGIKK